MGLAAFIRRLDRLAGRFNRWFAPAAVASTVERNTSSGVTADPTSVVAVLTGMQKENQEAESDDDATR
jgi:hypothetical protein